MVADITAPSPVTASPHRWLVLAIVSIALLLIVIDMTVLYTALPRLTHDLQASASAKLWIVNSYTLVVSGLILGMGTLGDRLGHKRLFIAGLVVFGLASLLAAFAASAAVLIGARVVLGIGAAMMMPATLSLIRLSFSDARERALAIGIWASVASGGAAFGPVVGGILLEHFWWGSVFLVNVPIVLLALPLAARFIHHTVAAQPAPWDGYGSAQVMVGLVAATFGIKEAGKVNPDWMLAVMMLAIGAVVLTLFVRRQRRLPHPLLDLRLFVNPGFSAAVVAALLSSAALLGMQLVFSQRLQLVEGLSPLQAGMAILPLPLAAFVAGPLAGRLLHRWDGRTLLMGSLLLATLGMGSYWLLYQHSGGWQTLSLAVLGFGIGATMTAASATIMLSAAPEQAGMAASVEEVSYELGGALGVTLMGTLLSAVYARHMPLAADDLLPAVVRDSLDEALLVAERLPAGLAHSLMEAARGAFEHGYAAVLLACALLLLAAAIGVVWSLRGRADAPKYE